MRDSGVPLIGRDQESNRLRGLLPDKNGRAVGAVLVGEAGIGKSRLVEALAQTAKQRGFCVARGGAYEMAEPLPYGLFADTFSQWAREQPTLLNHARNDMIRPLSRVVPAFAAAADLPALKGLSGPDERFRLFESAVHLLHAVAVESPLLLVLEDLHWADRESWSMLLHCLRSTRSLPLLTVITLRPDETGGEPLELNALMRESELHRIAVRSLEPADTMRMLESLADERLPASLATAIHRETGGNPFYVRQLFNHLVEEGKLAGRQGQWPADLVNNGIGIPAGLRPLLSRRFARLSGPTLGMLRIAAIFPEGFDLGRLQLLISDSEETILDHIDEAMRAGVLVVRGDGYVFAHALLRRALYDELNPDRRAILHRRAATRLAELDADPGEIAHQYHASQRIPGAEIGEVFALNAAERARANYISEHEAVFLRIACDLAGDAASDEMLRDLALAQAASLDVEAADATTRFLFSRCWERRPSWTMSFLVAIVRRLRDAGAPAEMWQPLVERGLEACDDRRDLYWARLEVLRQDWRCRWNDGTFEAIYHAPDPRALDLVRQLGDEEDRASALDLYAPRSIEQTEQVQRWAAEWQNPAAIIRAREVVTHDWIYRHGQLALGVETAHDLLRDAKCFGSLPGRIEALTSLAIAEASLGHLASSDAALRDARALAVRLGPWHRLHLALELSAVAWRAYLYGGDWPAIGRVASRALQIVKDHPVRLGQIVLGFAALTEAFLPGENEYDVRIEALLRSLENTNSDRQLSDDALGLGVCAAWQREDVKRARRFEALVRAPKHGSTIGAAGECREFILGRLAALQDHTVAARAHFAKARGDLDRAGQVCLRALVDLDEATVAGTSGDKPSSRALLQRGREQFVALGMRSWQERVDRARIEGVEAESRNLYARGPDDLSPREMEILSKLAAGSRSKAIAAELRLSVPTVNRHIANIYMKIGVSSRAAATAYAMRHRLSVLQ
ncbi:helix-turn-helix transcriptional regulator [Bradyrhizobium sp. SZCCHNPS1003]|uniref:helix-turn-helix transcriptional regulator n=1 Tax=Bradyrhizobium sp. SZCCHNPS1003 TaxID=3057330 RepID=UPI0028E217BF|nr:AAA family ATPase [Bradyrhizobium sp. SZCCHNPS1003]